MQLLMFGYIFNLIEWCVHPRFKENKLTLMATAGVRKRASATKCAIDKKKLNELWEKTSQSTLFFFYFLVDSFCAGRCAWKYIF